MLPDQHFGFQLEHNLLLKRQVFWIDVVHFVFLVLVLASASTIDLLLIFISLLLLLVQPFSDFRDLVFDPRLPNRDELARHAGPTGDHGDEFGGFDAGNGNGKVSLVFIWVLLLLTVPIWAVFLMLLFVLQFLQRSLG